MANEIKVTAKITYNNTPIANISRAETDVTFNITGTRYTQIVQDVSTTEEPLELGDVPSAGLGWCWLKNLDPANYINVGPAAADAYLIKLKPLEPAVFRLNTSIVPVVKANSADCDMEVLILED